MAYGSRRRIRDKSETVTVRERCYRTSRSRGRNRDCGCVLDKISTHSVCRLVRNTSREYPAPLDSEGVDDPFYLVYGPIDAEDAVLNRERIVNADVLYLKRGPSCIQVDVNASFWNVCNPEHVRRRQAGIPGMRSQR